jgi:hypothetical protein
MCRVLSAFCFFALVGTGSAVTAMIYEPGFVVLNGVGRGAPVDMFECGRKRQIMLLLEKKV